MSFHRSHGCAGLVLMFFSTCLSSGDGIRAAALDRTAEPAAVSAYGALQSQQGAAEILRKIEHAIAEGDARVIAKYFAPKVYLNFPAGENGYFSAEQSYHILRGFFRTYPASAFAFSSSTAVTAAPYGVGALVSSRQGRPVTVQIFVSLTRADRDWKIAQITAVQR